ncbi:hypothetical protein [Merdimmobilis hominis]|jgi:hypothetical protein|uniref:Uncharacterized protein n=1 Tax=uncultured Anaerotruncus sp. TaxID=905011 RepID=A0A6N2TM08_9FIRM|nr:hypothetical protein [Merdimmobilis hominis]MCD4835711.1 hypothetical protein [Merdimmobilis hominis]PWL57150.1 MAG: hypothetical protein DBY34_09400 [Oscillospiraceae bacterium]
MGKVEFDFRGVDFFQSKNKLSGSLGNFRYMMIPDGDGIQVYTYETYCFEVAPKLAETRVEMSDQGLQGAGEWLNAQYEAYLTAHR